MVDGFETAVFDQQPWSAEHYDDDYFASDWREGDNRYDLETRRRIEDRNPAADQGGLRARRACSTWAAGPASSCTSCTSSGVEVDGVDFSPDSRTLAPPRRSATGSPIGAVDRAARRAEQAYDLVICREVMEHLTVLQVRRTVAQICRASSRFVYVTTRFHPDPDDLLDFTTQFDVDPTHITLLTKDFLRCLFVLEGFRRRPDLEERMDWGDKDRVLVYERPQ